MEVVTVTCILCNGTVNFKNREPALFNAHMRDQHNTFYRIDYILASCFMQGQHLDKVEEEWAKMEREQRVEEVVEVDQEGEETNNGLNFEMLDEEEVGGGQDYNEVQEEVQLDQEEEVVMEEEEEEGKKRKSMEVPNSAKRRKHGNGDFKCGQCEHSYSTQGNLNVHLKKVHGWDGIKREMKKEIFESEIDDDMTGYESDANSSYVGATEAGKTTCDHCAREFKSAGRLSYHMATKHKDVESEGSQNIEERRNVPCEQCPKTFMSKTGLKHHMKTKHDNFLPNTNEATADQGDETANIEEVLEANVANESNVNESEVKPQEVSPSSSKEFACAFDCGKSYSHKTTRDNHEIKEHNRPLKNKRKSKNPPAGSTFHLSSQQEEEEMVLEEGVADVSDVVDAEVEAAQNNLAEMEEEVAKAKEFEDDRTESEEGLEEEVADETDEEKEEEREDLEEIDTNKEESAAAKNKANESFNPVPEDPREEWRDLQPITPEEEKRCLESICRLFFIFVDLFLYLIYHYQHRFSDNLQNTKENAVENEMPILPPFVEQEDEEEKENKKSEPELEEKVDAAENKKENKKDKGNLQVDLTKSQYFSKHPKAIANPQERSVRHLPLFKGYS